MTVRGRFPRRLGNPQEWHGFAFLLPVLLPAVLFLSLYARSLDYELVWLDRTEIGQRTLIRPPGSVLEAFRQPLQGNLGYRESTIRQLYYRPLHVVLVSGIHGVRGDEPRAFRTFSLAFGALTAAVFGGLAWFLFRRIGPSLLAGSWAALHPAGIEVYVWLSAMSEAMCALLAITSLAFALCCLTSKRTEIRFALAFLSLAALVGAFLAKEKGIVAPVLLAAALPTLHRLRGPELDRPQWLRWAAGLWVAQVLAVLAYALAWRPAVLGGAFGRAAWIGGDPVTHLLSTLATWPSNLAWIFAPIHSSTSDVVAVVTSWLDPMVWLGSGAVLASLVAWVWLLRNNKPVAALGLAWIWIAYLPTSGLIPMTHARAVRYLSFSVFGAALLAADLLPMLVRGVPKPARHLLASALAVLLVAGLAERTWARMPDWQSDLSLFSRDVANDPDYREGRQHLTQALLEERRLAESEMQLKILLAQLREFPGRASYLAELEVYELACRVYAAAGRPRQIVRLWEEATLEKTASGAPSLLACLGHARERLGQPRAALEAYLEALRGFPDEPPAALSVAIARVHVRLDRIPEANDWLAKALRSSEPTPSLEAEIDRVRRLIRRASARRSPGSTQLNR